MLNLTNGILYRKISNKHWIMVSQLVAPLEMREFIFSHLLEQRYAVHLGRDRLAAIKCHFYWPNMSDDVARWCSECQKCARVKPGPGKGRSEIQQIRAYRPMSIIALDILDPLNPTYNSNQYIFFVVGDYFTKWKEAYPVPNHTAATVADKLVQELFLRLGFSTQIHSDQGPEFESQLFAEMCKLLDIDKSRTCPYNPKSDGMIERFSRSLIAMLYLSMSAKRIGMTTFLT